MSLMKNYINEKFRIFAVLLSILIIPVLAHSQENKVIDITVSGSGATQEEAKQNALRNAIEQAFGTFVSSNTEILNDELVKDEIVSIANGNIQKYEVISEVQKPDGYWANTLKVKVSVNKLISFCEGKGVVVEFKGGLFAINVKQQILNEEAEVKAVENMCEVLKEIGNNSFDYSIVVSDPIAADRENKNWKVPILVNVSANSNFSEIANYLMNTLAGISMTDSEVTNYLSLGKDVFSVAIVPLPSIDVKLNSSDKEKVENTENYQAK